MASKVARVLTLTLVVAGCFGKNIPRATPELASIGNATYAGTIERFGEPQGRMTKLDNGKKFDSLMYLFMSPVEGSSHNPGVVPTRAHVAHFHDDVLVGYEFTSSWEEDHSDFDEAKVPQIRQGTTTREGVVALLGEPTGRYTYPLSEGERSSALVYRYNEVQQGGGRSTSFEKLLVVTLDPSDVVRDVDFTSTTSQIDN